MSVIYANYLNLNIFIIRKILLNSLNLVKKMNLCHIYFNNIYP